MKDGSFLFCPSANTLSVAKLIAVLIVLFYILKSPTLQPVIDAMSVTAAWALTSVSSLIDPAITQHNTFVYKGMYSNGVDVLPSCLGLSLYLPWLAVVLVSPLSALEKAKAALVSFAAVQAFNLLRLVILLFARLHLSVDAFDAIHEVYFTGFMAIVTITLCLKWHGDLIWPSQTMEAHQDQQGGPLQDWHSRAPAVSFLAISGIAFLIWTIALIDYAGLMMPTLTGVTVALADGNWQSQVLPATEEGQVLISNAIFKASQPVGQMDFRAISVPDTSISRLGFNNLLLGLPLIVALALLHGRKGMREWAVLLAYPFVAASIIVALQYARGVGDTIQNAEHPAVKLSEFLVTSPTSYALLNSTWDKLAIDTLVAISVVLVPILYGAWCGKQMEPAPRTADDVDGL